MDPTKKEHLNYDRNNGTSWLYGARIAVCKDTTTRLKIVRETLTMFAVDMNHEDFTALPESKFQRSRAR